MITSSDHNNVETGLNTQEKNLGEQMPKNGNLLIDGEREVVTEVYVQAWEAVRHAQNMRTLYFNFFLFVVGASIAAIANLLGATTYTTYWQAIGIIGLVIWIMGILTLLRIERWTALVTHELHTVRQVREIFRNTYPILEPAIPRKRASIEGVEFTRPLWSRDRTIEPIACVIASGMGVSLAAFIAPLQPWAQICLSVVGIFVLMYQWKAEVKYQAKKHSKCCRGIH